MRPFGGHRPDGCQHVAAIRKARAPPLVPLFAEFATKASIGSGLPVCQVAGHARAPRPVLCASVLRPAQCRAAHHRSRASRRLPCRSATAPPPAPSGHHLARERMPWPAPIPQSGCPAGHRMAEDVCYGECGKARRGDGRLKDNLGGRTMRIRGSENVRQQKIFGHSALQCSNFYCSLHGDTLLVVAPVRMDGPVARRPETDETPWNIAGGNRKRNE